jgi:uncharacterized protein (TIGR02265 family)
MAQVKGTAVTASIRYVNERFGADAFRRILRFLPDADRQILEAGVLASSWYPMPLFLRFMQEAEQQLSPKEPDVIRRMGAASAEYGIRGVYKIFFRMGSPEFIIGRAARVFGSYYDTGRIEVVETGPGRAVLDLSGFSGAPQFCERILGWMEKTVQMAGAKNLRANHAACVHRGDAVCRFEGDWD